METTPPDAITESSALRALDWPMSRREELRALLPSVPAGQSRIYQKSRVEALKNPDELARVRSAGNGNLFTRSAPAAAPPAGLIHRTVEITRDAIDPRARTVKLSFSSEAPVERWFGIEVLSHAQGAVRLGRLNNGAALLLDHDPTRQVGIVVSAKIDSDGKGRAVVRFGKSALADEIFKDVEDGIRRLVSVGYRIHNQESQGTSGGVETVRVTDWEPYELSLVSIPADDSVGVGRGLNPSTPSQIEISEPMNNPQNTAAAERSRVQSIIGIAEQIRVSTGQQLDARAAIESGETAEQFRQRAFDAYINRGQVQYQPANSGASDYSPSERRDLSHFSLLRAVAALADGKGLTGIEREVDQEGRRISAMDGVASRSAGNLSLPPAVLFGSRDMTVTGGTNGDQGGTMVATELGAHIPLQKSRSVLRQLGATFLTGLRGNVAFPKLLTGSTAGHVAETAAVAESSPTTGQVVLSPHRLGSFIEVSKQLLIQSNDGIEAILRNDLNSALMLAMEAGAITGSGASDEPLGLIDDSSPIDLTSVIGGTDGGTPDWADILELEGAIASLNADEGRLGYLTNPAVRKILKKTVKATGIPEFCWEKGGQPLNGYGAEVTTLVPRTLTKGGSGAVCSALIFGNFADMLVGQWGGIDILVNPYSRDTEGIVRITADTFYDVAIRRAASFAAMRDALTA